MYSARITKILALMENIYHARHDVEQLDFSSIEPLLVRFIKDGDMNNPVFECHNGFLLIKDVRYLDFLIYAINRFSIRVERIVITDDLSTVLRYDNISDKIHVVFRR